MTDEINIRLGSLSDLNSIFNIEKTVFLELKYSNISVLKLYRKVGFKKYYSNNNDALLCA